MKKETDVWVKQAQEHYDDALYLFDGGRYGLAVYSCHQAIEKLLKAAIVEFANQTPPKIHNLDALARQTTLAYPNTWSEKLAEVTRHFWRVRYPDFRTYVYTSKETAEPTMLILKEVYPWILSKLNLS